MQQEVTMQATAVLATAPDPTSPATVCVRYEGNQSKRWDGKIVKLDRAWLEEVCGQELLVGTAVEMPWKCKGGKTELWKGVVVSDEPEEQLHHGKKERVSRSYCYWFSHLQYNNFTTCRWKRTWYYTI